MASKKVFSALVCHSVLDRSSCIIKQLWTHAFAGVTRVVTFDESIILTLTTLFYETSILIPADACSQFPPLRRGIKGDFVFKSLPASLYTGRGERPDNGFHSLDFCTKLHLSSSIETVQASGCAYS